ncbi:hypothetical protein [Aeoliella sp.]|uniref:hypothetical protein n=1 Tax=Aeoliella sp. TaxID=2795800 RepID=UPI003CCBD5D6
MAIASKSFSLRTLLWVTLVVCMGIATWNMSRKLHRAEAELRTLRDEVGRLTIEDRTMFHAIAIDTGEEHTWRWRCFFPKGYRYSVHAASKEIPTKGIPQSAGLGSYSNETVEEDIEVVVTARLRKAEDGAWRLTVTSRSGDGKSRKIPDLAINIPAEDMAWRETHSSVLSGTMGKSTTVTQEATEPIILRTYRPFYQDQTKLGTGYILWFQAHTPGKPMQ